MENRTYPMWITDPTSVEEAKVTALLDIAASNESIASSLMEIARALRYDVAEAIARRK